MHSRSKKDKKISENFFNRLEDVLQKVTDKSIEQLDQLMQKKKKILRRFKKLDFKTQIKRQRYSLPFYFY